MSFSPRIARVMANQAPDPTPVFSRRDPRAVLAGCDIGCTIDGSLPDPVQPASASAPGAPFVRVTTHTKKRNTVEIRILHEHRGEARHRVGTLNVPRLLWITVYRRMLLWACGEGIIHLTLDEHAGADHPRFSRHPAVSGAA